MHTQNTHIFSNYFEQLVALINQVWYMMNVTEVLFVITNKYVNEDRLTNCSTMYEHMWNLWPVTKIFGRAGYKLVPRSGTGQASILASLLAHFQAQLLAICSAVIQQATANQHTHTNSVIR